MEQCTYLFLLSCVRAPVLCLNLRAGLLCRKFPTVCYILSFNDVSGVLNFRRQVIGRRQGDYFY